MVMQKRIKRTWSFSGMATIVRIMLMYYINSYTFLEQPEKDWDLIILKANESLPQPSLLTERELAFSKINPQRLFRGIADENLCSSKV